MDVNFIITSRYFMDANLFLRNKFGYNVGIDLSLHRTMTEYFDLPSGSVLPVLEQEYCEVELGTKAKRKFAKISQSLLVESVYTIKTLSLLNTLKT